MKKVLNSEGYSSASSGGETVTNSIAGDKPTLSSQCTRVQRGRRCLPGNPNAAQQPASRAFTRGIVLCVCYPVCAVLSPYFNNNVLSCVARLFISF